ncbi:phage antirepressor N-terminal domain-containing protein [Methylobacterium sp. J-068]|uniref:phage antirepressor N-terminal domain-containing protein n=1 Tax=Methylobacterium sp. J-068 TaxID=2836649 RepID=UPI001FB9C04C|nr:phage antirepressor N-terminal domain-containing protein [Methylobacterium sp. J-068]MCJ2032643.1 phage antirepressor N-terminal domain-containing protein [Methylobacterium sp. J-068]
MSAAENLPAVQSVEFNGDRLATFEKDGERWVAMRPIVEAMGLAWEPQRRKLESSDRFACHHMVAHDSSGRRQEMTCIPLRRPQAAGDDQPGHPARGSGAKSLGRALPIDLSLSH